MNLYIRKEEENILLGTFFKTTRQNLNLSQVEVANNTSISQAVISRIENCMLNPSLEHYVLLKKCYGFSNEEIIFENN